MRKANIVAGSLAVICSLIIIIYTLSVFPASKQGVPGPGVFPVIVAGLMLCSGLFVLIGAIRSADNVVLKLWEDDNKRSYIVIAAMCLYIALIPVVGFCVMTGIFLTGLIKWFSGRTVVKSAIWALSVTMVIFSVFTYVLKVPLIFGLLI